MSACHERSLQTSTVLSHVQLGCTREFVCMPYLRNDIGVWNLMDMTSKPVVLSGHSRPVTGLCFSQRCSSSDDGTRSMDGSQSFDDELLLSASSDYLILWRTDAIKSAFNSQSGENIRGKVLCNSPGLVHHVCFSRDNDMVAACVERNVHVFEVKSRKSIALLEGHTAQVNCAQFCFHYSSTLVTASEDRTFKIWGLESSCLLYQSTIISSSPFISLAMNPRHNSFAVGSVDGQVRVYDLTEGNDFRCLHRIDVDKMLWKLRSANVKETADDQFSDSNASGPKVISSKPSWQRLQASNDGCNLSDSAAGDEPSPDSEPGSAILSLLYTGSSRVDERNITSGLKSTHLSHNNKSIVSELFEAPPILVVGTTGAILQLNMKTLEPVSCIWLNDPMLSHGTSTSHTVTTASNMTMSQSTLVTDKVWCVITKLFVKEVDILTVWCNNDAPVTRSEVGSAVSDSASIATESEWWMDGSSTASSGDETMISVLSSAPLLDRSILKAELVPKRSDTQQKDLKKPQVAAFSKPGSLDKKGRIIDKQPVTFHANIKPSGYKVPPPRTQMFQPKTNNSVKKDTKSSRSSRSSISESTVDSRKIDYPMNGDPPTSIQTALRVSEKTAAINSCRFTERGDRIACVLSNGSVSVFKSPINCNSEVEIAISGHDQMVSCVNWSHDDQWMITSSEDKTAKILSPLSSVPVMILSNNYSNIPNSKEGGKDIKDKDCRPFSHAVRHGQFFYMDRFILLSCADQFYLFKYYLDTSKSDLKRYVDNCKYKLVKSFKMSQSQSITAFSAINSFYSYISICCGSDKSLEVFDLNVGSIVRTVRDIHSRSIHTVVQNSSSPYSSHPAPFYDLFLTSAVCDGIKLWDLRSSRCVRRYEGHMNRVHPCAVAFSPCGRFIASGSEDKCAYIFDIRQGTYLHKLTGHTETVLGVTFNPKQPQLLTTTMDGYIRSFVAP